MRGLGIFFLGAAVCCAAYSKEPPLTKAALESLAQSQNRALFFTTPENDPEKLKSEIAQAQRVFRKATKSILALPSEQATFDNTVIAFDRALDALNRVLNRLDLTLLIDSDSAAATIAAQARRKLARICDHAYLDRQMYDRLREFEDIKGLTSEQKRLLQVTLAGFDGLPKHMSEHLDQWEIQGLSSEIETRTARFERQLARARKVLLLPEELQGLPLDLAKSLPFDGRRYEIDAGTYWQTDAVMRFAQNRGTRQRVWMAANHVPANRDLVEEIVAGRRRMAQRLGHTSWASYNMDGMSMTSGVLLRAFAQLKKKTQAAFEAEKAEMAGILGEEPELWDVTFLQQKAFDALGLEEAALKTHFPMEQVAARLFGYVERMFGVKILPVADAGLWEGARGYVIQDAHTGQYEGTFTWDPFAREGKNASYQAQLSVGGQVREDGIWERPHGLLLTNFAPCEAQGRCQLTFEEVWSLFHELGHILHLGLSQHRYYSLGPFWNNLDLIEFPSTLMERLAWEPKVLQAVMGVPEGLAKRIAAGRTLYPTHQVRSVLARAEVDLRIHSARGRGVQKVEHDVYAKTYYPLPKGVSLTSSSSHFSGYDSVYWTYLFSEALVQTELKRLRQAPRGVLDSAEGMRLRRRFLEQGTEQPSGKLIQRVVGRLSFCSSLLESYGLTIRK